MEVQKRRRGGNTYLYLVQSYREAGKVRKVERYLGRREPASLSILKEELGQEVISRQWGDQLAGVKARYEANLEKMPSSIRVKELETFAIEFTYDSNRIEGSSLTFRETASLLEHGITPGNRPLSDVQESLAHRTVFISALSERGRLDLTALLHWHKELFKTTKPEYAGVVRRHQAMIGGSKFIPPAPFELDRLLTEFFDWLGRAWRHMHPVVLAALVHLKLVTIHPFGDGNGRVTRIAMNFVLHRKGFPMFDIPYERRVGYHSALERAQATQDEFLFVRWFVKRYLDENTRRLRIPGLQRRSE
jgi:cell filamentation protein, protein adenylyltransferase